ncbi:uncharacterized protein IWZ02DRAFT_436679 [Phyllosticta citriasiana]|uniref:uncharacterized protein n=1 Tax=Phyllosticta citriasiana TaxID=595635 RepID=UPI0030FDEE33
MATSTDMNNATRCRFCGEDFHYHTKLISHCKANHPGEPVYRCNVCNLVTTNGFYPLKQHLEGPCGHPNAAQEIEQLRLKAASNPYTEDATTNMDSVFWRTTCRFCSHLAANEKGLLSHVNTQHSYGDHMFKCGRCFHLASTVSNFTKHFDFCQRRAERLGLSNGQDDNGEVEPMEGVECSAATQDEAGPQTPTQPTRGHFSQKRLPGTHSASDHASQSPPAQSEDAEVYQRGSPRFSIFAGLASTIMPQLMEQLVPVLKEELGEVIKSAVHQALGNEQSHGKSSDDTTTVKDAGQGTRKEALQAEVHQLSVQLNEFATRLVEVQEELRGMEEQDVDEEEEGEEEQEDEYEEEEKENEQESGSDDDEE